MGLADKLRGRQPCPVCSGPVDTVGPREMLCKKCDTYLELAEKTLRPIPEDRVAKNYVFGVPTPWKDVRAVTFPGGFSAPAAQLTDLVLTKKTGIRVLEAQWPAGCCVCGKPSSHNERHGREVIFPREWGIINLGSQKATLVADGIPHCGEHSEGAVFDRVSFAILGSDLAFGLLFRSLAYRNAFRKLNPWPWPAY
jgi:hypothetical protein